MTHTDNDDWDYRLGYAKTIGRLQALRHIMMEMTVKCDYVIQKIDETVEEWEELRKESRKCLDPDEEKEEK